MRGQAADAPHPGLPPVNSIAVERKSRPLRSVPDARHRDRAFVRDAEVDQISIGLRDGAPDIISPDQRIGERIQGDALNRGSDICPDGDRGTGVRLAIAKADPREIRNGFEIVPDIHGPKRAKAASTSSSLAYTPARDRSRARSSDARSSRLRPSKIDSPASEAPSCAGSTRSIEPVVVCGRGVVMPAAVAHPPRRRDERSRYAAADRHPVIDLLA